MRRAYELCAFEWGPDDRWLDVATRHESRYSVNQYGTVAGDVVEIFDGLQCGMGCLEVAAERLADPHCRLTDVHLSSANTDMDCVQVGGWLGCAWAFFFPAAYPCPYPGCLRVFNVSSNMRRHYKNHDFLANNRPRPQTRTFQTSFYSPPLQPDVYPPPPLQWGFR